MIEFGDIQQNSRIWFKGEKKPYKVRVRNDRFLICTKPFNLQHTVFYTIVDIEKNIRGSEGLVFGMGAESYEDCVEMLGRLSSGETEISRRNSVELVVERCR